MSLEVELACAKAQRQECVVLLLIVALGSSDDAPAPRFSVPLSTRRPPLWNRVAELTSMAHFSDQYLTVPSSGC